MHPIKLFWLPKDSYKNLIILEFVIWRINDMTSLVFFLKLFCLHKKTLKQIQLDFKSNLYLDNFSCDNLPRSPLCLDSSGILSTSNFNSNSSEPNLSNPFHNFSSQYDDMRIALVLLLFLFYVSAR